MMNYITLHGEQPKASTTPLAGMPFHGLALTTIEPQNLYLEYHQFDLDIKEDVNQDTLNAALNYASSAVNELRWLLAEQHAKHTFNPVEVADKLDALREGEGVSEHYKAAYSEMAKLAREGSVGPGVTITSYPMKDDSSLVIIDLNEPLTRYSEVFKNANPLMAAFGVDDQDTLTGKTLYEAILVGIDAEEQPYKHEEIATSALCRLGVDAVKLEDKIILLTADGLDFTKKQTLSPPKPDFLRALTTDPVIVFSDGPSSPDMVDHRWHYYAVMDTGEHVPLLLTELGQESTDRLAVIATLDEHQTEHQIAKIDWETVLPIPGQVCFEDEHTVVYAGTENKNEQLINAMIKPAYRM